MKKILLSLAMAASMATAFGAPQLQTLPNGNKGIMSQANNGTFVTRGDSENSMVFGYCTGLATAVGVPGYVLEGVIEIPEDLAQQWIGNKVTAIRVGFGQSGSKAVNLYVTESLDAVPQVLQQSYITEELAWNELELREPYVINGSSFYVGYQSMCSVYGTDFPIGVDGNVQYYSEYGDIVGMNDEYTKIGDYYGNVALQVVIEGDNNLPQVNAKVNNIYIPDVVQPGVPFEGGFLINNYGIDPIESINYTFTLGGETAAEGDFSFDTPIPQGGLIWLVFDDLVSNVSGDKVPVKVTVNSVNGISDSNPDDNTLEGTYMCAVETFSQKAFVEEFTGTWCGFCPRGIVGMAYMEENYAKEGFIGVAVHVDDPMVSQSWVDINYAYSRGEAPSAVMNRNAYFDPSITTLEEEFNKIKNQKAIAKMEIAAANYNEENNSLVVTGVATFGLDIADNDNYSLAFGLVENGVGPYWQTNYFGGTDTANVGEWTGLPSSVNTIYNEVGRIIADPFGIEGSLPKTIKALEGNSYTTEIPLSYAWNIDNCFVVAIIIDKSTGIVVNACKETKIGRVDSAVEGIETELVKTYKVYNTQGIKVLETKESGELNLLPKGIYIINGKKVRL